MAEATVIIVLIIVVIACSGFFSWFLLKIQSMMERLHALEKQQRKLMGEESDE